MVHRRDEFHAQAVEHIALVAPIRRLPDEILAEIFNLTVDDRRLSDRSFRCHLQPLVLGQICRHWREVSLSTPAIWSQIEIDFSEIEKRAPMINLFLERAKITPLSLRLMAQWSSHSILETDCGTKLDNFMSSCERWQALHIIGGTSLHTLISKVKHSMLALHTLSLTDDTFMDENIIHAYESAPRLRYLSLVGGGSLPKRLRLPWDQLTEIQIERPISSVDQMAMQPWSVADCLFILDICPKLTALTLGYVLDWPSNSTYRDTHHHNLRTLQCYGDVTELLARLILPSLQSLQLFYNIDDEDLRPRLNVPVAEISRLVERSSCVLKDFTLSVNSFPPQVISCLQSLTELEALHVRSDCCNALLKALTVCTSNGTHQLCPWLTRIELSPIFSQHDQTLDQDQLRAFIRSRCISNPDAGRDTDFHLKSGPLQNTQIITGPESLSLRVDLAEDIAKLQQLGIVISCHTSAVGDDS